jgi:hypothetical protein
MEWLTKPRQADQPFGSWANDLAAAFVRLEPRKIADQITDLDPILAMTPVSLGRVLSKGRHYASWIE